jgi:long-chain acyl-CoA synthetase
MERCESNLPLESFYWRVKRHPEKIYFTQPLGNGEIKEYTWSDVEQEAKTLAAYIKSLNYPAKSHIALLSKNCAFWMITDLAIWMSGNISIPLYPTLNKDSVKQILEHSNSKLLFVGKLDGWKQMKPGVPSNIPMVATPLSQEDSELSRWEDMKKDFSPINDSPTFKGEELATIIYTSGSTGHPKGAKLNFGAIGFCSNEIQKFCNTNENDRILSYLPMAHVMERWIVETHSFNCGMQIFFAESIDTFVKDLQRATPTVFVSVPRLWLKFQQGVSAKMPEQKLNFLLKLPIISGIIKKKILTKLGLQHVRIAATGSAPIPSTLINWYQNLGLELLEGYGMTENFAYSHISVPGKTRIGYVGNTFAGVEHRITEEGEIQVKSPGNIMGYYNNEELSLELFTEDGFVRTGDRGEIDSEGRLKITGRTKELFKTSKGKYVAPAPIENKILATNLAELACVSGSGRPCPYALLLLSENIKGKLANNELNQTELTVLINAARTAINKDLDHHEQLQFMVVTKEPWTTENNLLTPTMKVKRANIEKTYGPKEDGWYNEKQTLIWE